MIKENFTPILNYNLENFVVLPTINVSIFSVLLVNSIIFSIAIVGIIFNRRNLLILLMSVELMLLSVSMNFVVFSIYLNDSMGQVYAMLILALIAAESALTLAILVIYYRITKTVELDQIRDLRG
jgi:NADH-quinone oxidoreductase subunit K